MTDIKHFTTCSANYPEKTRGELGQAVTRITLNAVETVVQCNDCGAFVIEARQLPATRSAGLLA